MYDLPEINETASSNLSSEGTGMANAIVSTRGDYIFQKEQYYDTFLLLLLFCICLCASTGVHKRNPALQNFKCDEILLWFPFGNLTGS